MKIMNNKYTLMHLSLALSLLLLGGCGSEKKTTQNQDKGKERIDLPEYLEPDSYFNEAIGHFEAGEMEDVANQIKLAIDYVGNVVIKDDTLHNSIIEFAVADLNDLLDNIGDSSITTTTDQLRETFAGVDGSIGRYHLTVIEDWIVNETNDERSLRRMHRSLIRTEYAIEHANIQLTDEEKAELEKAKTDVLKAEKASHSLWKRIKTLVKTFEDRVEENSNPLDGTF
jgi:hypothetical protein